MVWLSLQALGAEPSLAQPLQVAVPPTVTRTLENGTKLIVAPHRGVPTLALVALFAPGAAGDSPEKAGTIALTTELMRRGTKHRSADELALAVEALGASLDTSTDAEATGFHVECHAKDADTMVALLAEVVTSPRFEDAEHKKVQARWISSAKNDKSEPRRVIRRYFQRLIYGSGHAFGQSATGDEASLGRITLADVEQAYSQHFGADRLTLIAVGDIDPDGLAQTLEKHFSAFRKAAAPPPVPQPIAPAPVGEVWLVDLPRSEQTYFMLGSLGVSRHYPAQEALDLVRTLFGGRFTSMLNTALRIESGLTYGAQAIVSQPGERGFSAIYSYTQTDTTAEAIDLALSVLDKLHEGTITEADLASGRASIRGAFPLEFETAAQWAGQLGEMSLYGQSLERITGYLGRLEKVDRDKTRAIISECFPPRSALSMVWIGDATKLAPVAARYGKVTTLSIDTPGFGP